ncbi:acylphosphatase [Microstroma glucosiphilum]|uniref:acylphosphatase n=1 Tax=Pseudomicrostroma glucosiphilum TaxID=1684307 RepID=A0A316U5F1_9BASI|nr:acylphosphatase [Pseudomicrostroma glucosiphilum]PWN18185.1 acylphosphatase [Pseudomicrostroma glucosiphilum]
MIAFRITGLVQGVNFRSSTASKAKELSLRGWVRNTADEAVEGEASGDASSLQKFRSFLQKGPPGAQVDKADITEKSGGDDLPSPFAVRD